jgi:2'-5' RNA ligase
VSSEIAAAQPDSERRRRVFFALWPDAATTTALVRATRTAVRLSGGRPIAKERLHITVAFQWPQREQTRGPRGGSSRPGLHLLLDKLGWPHTACCGSPRHAAPALGEQAATGRRSGARFRARAWIPPPRRSRSSSPVEEPVTPVPWHVQDLALVESLPTAVASTPRGSRAVAALTRGSRATRGARAGIVCTYTLAVTDGRSCACLFESRIVRPASFCASLAPASQGARGGAQHRPPIPRCSRTGCREVAEIRGLSSRIQCEPSINPRGVRRVPRRRARAAIPPAIAEHYGKIARMLELYRGPEIADLQGLMRSVMTSQAAATTIPTKSVLRVDAGNEAAAGMAYAHEPPRLARPVLRFERLHARSAAIAR